MKVKQSIQLLLYFVGLALPILGMLNCSGFNAGNMAVQSCFIDHPLIRDYASFYYGWITVASFMAFIPVVLYIIVVVLSAELISKAVDKLIK
ncbi:MAG: hypothetical protein AAF705_04420 [Bacteroidota bacterium]